MATLSVGKAWEDSLSFVKREGALLFPVALLFLSIPLAILQHMVPDDYLQMKPGQTLASLPPLPASVSLAIVIGGAIMLIGSLAIYALALRPGISVGEALRLAIARLPVLIGVSVIVGFVLVLALFVAALIGGLLSAGIGQAGGLRLAVVLIVGVMLYVSARMVPLSAIVIDRRSGVIGSLRETIQLTRRQFGRLAAFLVISMALLLVVQIAVQSAFGVVGTLILGAQGGRSVSDIAVALSSGVLNVYLMVFTARLYRQLELAAA